MEQMKINIFTFSYYELGLIFIVHKNGLYMSSKGGGDNEKQEFACKSSGIAEIYL